MTTTPTLSSPKPPPPWPLIDTFQSLGRETVNGNMTPWLLAVAAEEPPPVPSMISVFVPEPIEVKVPSTLTPNPLPVAPWPTISRVELESKVIVVGPMISTPGAFDAN